LLLSDLVMPKVGGRELAVELRRTAARLKVLFVSGHAGHSAAENDPDLPGACFLGKPFTMQRLAQMVREVLDGIPQP